MNCYDVISRAVEFYKNRDKYIYFYGAKGQVLTDEVMDNLINAEPNYFKNRYDKTAMEYIRKVSRGKIGYDCSGFVSAVIGVSNYSTGHYSDTVNKTTPVKGYGGNLLYTTHNGLGRHVGIDIGAGRFLEMRREGHSIELGNIKEADWEYSGSFKTVDYTLAHNR